MADDVPQNAVAPLASIEANVVIAGVEAVTGIWVIYAAYTDQCVIPDLAETWHWSFAFYAILGFLGVVVAGFALEAAAGLIERVFTRPLWGRNCETVWQWYRTRGLERAGTSSGSGNERLEYSISTSLTIRIAWTTVAPTAQAKKINGAGFTFSGLVR